MMRCLAGFALLCSLWSSTALADWRVVNSWNEAARTAIANPGDVFMGPPQSARVLTVMHTCMYDVWTLFDGKAQGRFANAQGQTRLAAASRTPELAQAATSYAAYLCLRNLFPAELSKKSQEYFLQKLVSTAPDVAASLGGRSTAPALASVMRSTEAATGLVLAAFAKDGANQQGNYADTSGYASKNKLANYCVPGFKDCATGPIDAVIASPNTWQAHINWVGKKQVFVTPHWTSVMSFSLNGSDQFDALVDTTRFPPYGSAAYTAQNERILSFSKHLTQEHKAIVEYWADGPDTSLPPGHWGSYASQIVARDRLSLEKAIKLHFVSSNATMDAGIVIWHLKRKYDYVRPITSVRYEHADQTIVAWGGPDTPCVQTVAPEEGGCYARKIKGREWSPYNPGSNLTPAFPEFPSGHSGFSAAAARALELHTGSDRMGITDCYDLGSAQVEKSEKGIFCWKYPTFMDAALQAAHSRELGGIHFEYANSFSLRVGKMIGDQVYLRAKRLFDGEASRTR